MYSRLYVPVDNSEHSNQAVEVAVALASRWGATCVGSHVYAARMHDYRFKQMEYTLPDEYQDESELLRQRRIHDSLITTGLQLISDSYTDVMHFRCLEAGVPFEPKKMDGRNWEELVKDINENDYDLVVMGALGMGAVKESKMGSVAARVLRRVRTDTLLIRSVGENAMEGNILVTIDGSPQCFAGLRTAIELGKALDKKVEAIAVYDPYLHYAVFNSIVDVLSEKASKVFRFKEQEALHEEIIDTGLAKIYESHLKVARATAQEMGVDLPITLLDGKAFEQIVRYARDTKPWMIVMGRIGIHSDSSMDMGSNTEQLLQLAPCNMLITSRTFVPPIDMRADAAVNWTSEAEARMAKVPVAARGIARTAVLRWAIERGHSVVSSGNVEEALEELMPYSKGMRRIEAMASTLAAAEEAMIEEAPIAQARAVCRTCGYAARAATPVECPVCGSGADSFEPISAELFATVAVAEGDASETSFDGTKLSWTMDARTLLHQIPAGYLRRRVKAIVEKAARTRKLPAITYEIAAIYVQPELDALDVTSGPHRAPIAVDAAIPAHAGSVDGRLPWAPEAESRLERIPDGYLRSLAREQIERLAMTVASPEVTVLHVEAGIAEVRSTMRTTVAAAREEDATPSAASGCPVMHASTPDPEPAASGCPVSGHGSPAVGPAVSLNEVTGSLVESLGKRVTYGDQWVDQSGVTWSLDAQNVMELIPPFCREMVRRGVVWGARQKGVSEITPEMVLSLAMAGDDSPKMAWNETTLSKVAAVPQEFRGMVIQGAEERARTQGAARVDDSHLVVQGATS